MASLCLCPDSSHVPVPHPFFTPVLGLQAGAAVSGFYIGAEDLTSGLHTRTSTLPSKPSSQPRWDAFDFKDNHRLFTNVFTSYCEPSTMVNPEKEKKN